MKKKLILFIISLLLVFPAMFTFVACGEDDNKYVQEVVATFNQPQYANEYNEINLEYGQDYSFDLSDFKVEKIYNNGDKDQCQGCYPESEINIVAYYAIFVIKVTLIVVKIVL